MTQAPERPYLPAPPRRRGNRGRLAVTVLLSLALAAGATFLVVKTNTDDSADPEFPVPILAVDPGTALAHATPPPPAQDLRAWAEKLAAATNIPTRTLMAYANADLIVRKEDPTCRLTWPTLAGIGRVESHHGHFHGARVSDDGTLTQPIIGIPLDGSDGVKAIKDTDKGLLDGDPQWDRAVGFMQFLPTTWRQWAERAANDGQPPNPQNVDDAALTAARYLCNRGGNLATGDGWWKAVFTYNQSVKYAREVYSGATAYATKAAELARP